MDLFERLTRAFMRRKYSRVDGERLDRAERLTKSKSAKSPRLESTRLGRKLAAGRTSPSSQHPEPVIISLPKNFTLRSSSNDVIDGAWFNSALRRSVAEGRVTLS